MKRLALVTALAACQMESTSPQLADLEQSLTNQSYCNATMPPIKTWDGVTPPAQLSNGRYILLKSQQYQGWYALFGVDLNKYTTVSATWVHDSKLNQMAAHLIREGIRGPGGTPPPPPCQFPFDQNCSRWLTAIAIRDAQTPYQAIDDINACQ